MRQSIARPNRHCSGERGFTLVLVIWGLGLISLIALTVITVGRRRNLVVANLIENAKAESLAEAGVNLRRLELRAAFSSDPPNTLPFPTNGEPLPCTMPQGALAALAVEDEGGKSGFWYRRCCLLMMLEAIFAPCTAVRCGNSAGLNVGARLWTFQSPCRRRSGNRAPAR
jgi:hypothetical protein